MEKWKILLLQLREIARIKGITINELAEKRKMKQSSISSFFSTKNPPSLANFIEMCDLLEIKLTLEGINGEVIEAAHLEAIAKMQLEIINKRNKTIDSIFKK